MLSQIAKTITYLKEKLSKTVLHGKKWEGEKGMEREEKGRWVNEGIMGRKETAPFLHHRLFSVLNS